jgi:hypothetical protein
MNKAILLLMLIALVWGGCTTSPHVSQDMFLVNQGFEELSNSNYLEAEAYLRAALDVNPNNPYTLLNLGVVFQDTGRTKEAIQMYQKVLELNPKKTAVKSNREGYSGKKIVEIARENLKSLGIFIAQKGPPLNTMDLGVSVVTDSEVKPVAIPDEAQLQFASYSAAVHASALDTEGNQDTVDMASMGGLPGIGASAEGPGGDAASGGGSTGGGSGGTGSGGGASDGGSADGGSGDSGSGGDSSDGGGSGDDGSSSDGDSGSASDGHGGGHGDGHGVSSQLIFPIKSHVIFPVNEVGLSKV